MEPLCYANVFNLPAFHFLKLFATEATAHASYMLLRVILGRPCLYPIFNGAKLELLIKNTVASFLVTYEKTSVTAKVY